MENGAFAPDGIISVQKGGGLIQEGANNIDLNTETKGLIINQPSKKFCKSRWHFLQRCS
jgi:hypothetical protein